MRKYIGLLGMLLLTITLTGCNQTQEELLDSQEIEILEEEQEVVGYDYALEDLKLTSGSEGDTFVIDITGDVITEYSEATINGDQAIFMLSMEMDAVTVASFSYESGQTVVSCNEDNDAIVSIIIDGDSLTIHATNFPYGISEIEAYTTMIVIDGETKYNYVYTSDEVEQDTSLLES